MSTLITGDIHFSSDPDDSYRFELVPWMCEFIKKNKVDNLIILGDLTKAKDRHDARLVNKLMVGLSELAAVAKQVVIIKGNHDYIDPGIPFFGFARNLRDNIDFINFPVFRKFELVKGKQRACLFLPSTREFKADWRGLDWDLPEYIFAHQTFNNSMSESGHLLEAGDELRAFEKRIFNGARLVRVVSGDVHKPQLLRRKKLLYVGAPYHIRFGDQFSPRLIHIDDAGKWKSVHFDTVSKLVIEIKDGHRTNKLPVKPKAGDLVRFRVDGDKHDLETWAEYESHARKMSKKHGWVFKGIELNLQTTTFGEQTKTPGSALVFSDEDVFNQFCTDKGLSNRTVLLGQEIMELCDAAS